MKTYVVTQVVQADRLGTKTPWIGTSDDGIVTADHYVIDRTDGSVTFYEKTGSGPIPVASWPKDVWVSIRTTEDTGLKVATAS